MDIFKKMNLFKSDNKQAEREKPDRKLGKLGVKQNHATWASPYQSPGGSP
jgi:hypothetical protein